MMFDTLSLKGKDRCINKNLNKYKDSTIQEMIAFMKYQSEKEKSTVDSQAKQKEKKRKDTPNQEGRGGGRGCYCG